MSKSTACSILAIALSGAAMAQTVIGTVENVKGLVTVSDANSVTTVVKGAPVVDGARYVTSSGGSVTLSVNRNCTVELKPNQSVVVNQDKTCPVLLALVQDLPAAGVGPVVAGTSPGSGGSTLALLGAAAAAGLLIANQNGGTVSAPPISGQ